MLFLQNNRAMPLKPNLQAGPFLNQENIYYSTHMKGKVGQKGKYLIAQGLIFSGFCTQHSAYDIAAEKYPGNIGNDCLAGNKT